MTRLQELHWDSTTPQARIIDLSVMDQSIVQYGECIICQLVGVFVPFFESAKLLECALSVIVYCVLTDRSCFILYLPLRQVVCHC